ncbi:RNA polymerase sigma factor [Chitinophaga sp. MM2321]|uniref:RNA polymerase sigma factor n=1 Tax=Chitinophaga sp. MM2321 TaxID=3137178 RepID=UPI0032D59D34
MEALRAIGDESSRMPDNMVVKRILSGEKELFEILLRRYNQTLYRVIRSYLKEEDDVSDAMQETYLKAYEKLQQYHGTAAFSTWLIRIGINEALQRIRSVKKHPTVCIDDGGDDSGKIFQLSDNHQMNPEKQAIQQETRRLIEESIDQLSDKYRIIYMLKEVEGMGNSDIAACLGISDSNVKVRLHRAKSLLKEALYKQSSGKDIFEFGNIRCDRIVDYVMKRI